MGTMVTTNEASAAAGKRIGELLDEKQPREAVAFAEDCEGPQQITDQLRAIAYMHAGAMRRDRTLLENATGKPTITPPLPLPRSAPEHSEYG